MGLFQLDLVVTAENFSNTCRFCTSPPSTNLIVEMLQNLTILHMYVPKDAGLTLKLQWQ